MLIRATARSSALLFLLAFAVRALHQIWRSEASAWLLRNRRYVGVTAALSHVVHLCAIVRLTVGWPESYVPDAVTLVFGGLGFVFFFAMGLTSFDAAVQALGSVNWRRLHRTGAWYVWFIFAFTFVPDPSRGWDALHAFAVVAFVGSAALRLFVWLFPRQRQTVTSA